MKAIAYNIKPKEKEWLVLANDKKHDITIIANHLSIDTIPFAQGKEVLLVFNQDEVTSDLIFALKNLGIKYIATASNQTNHIDLKAAGEAGLKCSNVPFGENEGITEASIEQVIKNLDQWAAGKCVGKACCCANNCGTKKTNP
ncbi:MAG: lactate dehydrogenase [Sphingobacteriaceae bacterium]|nr:lactate dehydrogenase [Sphingobacteriaceae bacterium]